MRLPIPAAFTILTALLGAAVVHANVIGVRDRHDTPPRPHNYEKSASHGTEFSNKNSLNDRRSDTAHNTAPAPVPSHNVTTSKPTELVFGEDPPGSSRIDPWFCRLSEADGKCRLAAVYVGNNEWHFMLLDTGCNRIGYTWGYHTGKKAPHINVYSQLPYVTVVDGLAADYVHFSYSGRGWSSDNPIKGAKPDWKHFSIPFGCDKFVGWDDKTLGDPSAFRTAGPSLNELKAREVDNELKSDVLKLTSSAFCDKENTSGKCGLGVLKVNYGGYSRWTFMIFDTKCNMIGHRTNVPIQVYNPHINVYSQLPWLVVIDGLRGHKVHYKYSNQDLEINGGSRCHEALFKDDICLQGQFDCGSFIGFHQLDGPEGPLKKRSAEVLTNSDDTPTPDRPEGSDEAPEVGPPHNARNDQITPSLNCVKHDWTKDEGRCRVVAWRTERKKSVGWQISVFDISCNYVGSSRGDFSESKFEENRNIYSLLPHVVVIDKADRDEFKGRYAGDAFTAKAVPGCNYQPPQPGYSCFRASFDCEKFVRPDPPQRHRSRTDMSVQSTPEPLCTKYDWSSHQGRCRIMGYWIQGPGDTQFQFTIWDTNCAFVGASAIFPAKQFEAHRNIYSRLPLVVVLDRADHYELRGRYGKDSFSAKAIRNCAGKNNYPNGCFRTSFDCGNYVNPDMAPRHQVRDDLIVTADPHRDCYWTKYDGKCRVIGFRIDLGQPKSIIWSFTVYDAKCNIIGSGPSFAEDTLEAHRNIKSELEHYVVIDKANKDVVEGRYSYHSFSVKPSPDSDCRQLKFWDQGPYPTTCFKAKFDCYSYITQSNDTGPPRHKARDDTSLQTLTGWSNSEKKRNEGSLGEDSDVQIEVRATIPAQLGGGCVNTNIDKQCRLVATRGHKGGWEFFVQDAACKTVGTMEAQSDKYIFNRNIYSLLPWVVVLDSIGPEAIEFRYSKDKQTAKGIKNCFTTPNNPNNLPDHWCFHQFFDCEHYVAPSEYKPSKGRRNEHEVIEYKPPPPLPLEICDPAKTQGKCQFTAFTMTYGRKVIGRVFYVLDTKCNRIGYRGNMKKKDVYSQLKYSVVMDEVSDTKVRARYADQVLQADPVSCYGDGWCFNMKFDCGGYAGWDCMGDHYGARPCGEPLLDLQG